MQYTAYGEVYLDSNPDFPLVVGFHGGLYDPLTKLVHFTQRDYDVLAGRWTSPDYSIWPKIGKDPSPFNLYMFKNNNPLSDMLDVKNYVTGSALICFLDELHYLIFSHTLHNIHLVISTNAPSSANEKQIAKFILNNVLQMAQQLCIQPMSHRVKHTL